MHVYPSLRTREVLTVDEKQQFATEVNPRRIVPVKSPENPRYSVSGGNREIIDPKMDADILEKVREIEGMNPVLITGKKAIEGVYRPSEYDVLGVCKDTEWYGNMRGSNSFRNERVGVVIGSPHFGDSYIKMLGALRGKRIEQVSENRGNELDYRVVGDESDSFGNDVYRHMTEDAVYQAVMRFGRDGERTDIFVRTSKLPEWVPTVEPITVEYVPRLQSEIKSIVGSQHRDSPWWKTDEISDRIPHEPKRKIERALNELDEHGEVERDSSGGQGARWKVVDPSD
ncbi:hypothetical protein BRC90_01310 [Halobacteriales archaeon QS_4_69_34]|nr:MAG: hypothetical protein BRC90_01310 [Halobacteriales archaeon QS_4_69_34]